MEDHDDQTVSGVTAVERMLLEVWQVEADNGGMVRTAMILPIGETLGDVTVTDRASDDKDDSSGSIGA